MQKSLGNIDVCTLYLSSNQIKSIQMKACNMHYAFQWLVTGSDNGTARAVHWSFIVLHIGEWCGWCMPDEEFSLIRWRWFDDMVHHGVVGGG